MFEQLLDGDAPGRRARRRRDAASRGAPGEVRRRRRRRSAPRSHVAEARLRGRRSTATDAGRDRASSKGVVRRSAWRRTAHARPPSRGRSASPTRVPPALARHRPCRARRRPRAPARRRAARRVGRRDGAHPVVRGRRAPRPRPPTRRRVAARGRRRDRWRPARATGATVDGMGIGHEELADGDRLGAGHRRRRSRAGSTAVLLGDTVLVGEDAPEVADDLPARTDVGRHFHSRWALMELPASSSQPFVRA